MKKHLILAVLLLCHMAVLAQFNFNGLRMPAASPHAGVYQEVGLTDIKIHYSSPSLNKRDVFADAQVVPKAPSPWRAGADENTTLQVSTDVTIAGKTLPAGKYGLHALVKDGATWTVILNKNNQQWGSYAYNEKEDVLRFEAEVKEVAEPVEQLKYYFSNTTPTSTVANLAWGKKHLSFKIEIDLQATVLPSLRHQLTGLDNFFWGGWDAAAQWCLASNMNLEEALTWANRSIANEQNVSNLGTKATVLMKLGRVAEADAVEKQILEVANPQQMLQLIANTYGTDKTKAKRYLDYAHNKYPKAWQTLNAWAFWYRMEKDLPKALEYYKQTQAAAPNEVKANFDTRIKGLEEQLKSKK